MTNAALAELLGCHFSTASRWRSGKRLPGVRLLAKISAVLGIPHDDLVVAHEAGPVEFSRLLNEHIGSE